MDKKTLNHLIDRINSGEATDEELAAYNHYLNQATDAGESWNEQRLGSEETFGAEMLDEINRRIGYVPTRTIRLWPRIAAAASVLIFLSIGGYFLLHKQHPAQIAQNQTHDIAPGGNKAVLTLANGQKVVLTGAANGRIALQANTQISKAADGIVQYSASTEAKSTTVYNTLTTPRKGRYEIILADGTEATLDAASSITYPVAFTGSDRKVSITGQVYFKVKHDAAHPFSVSYKGMTVEDIGTEFNISAYDDEPAIQTTLISGAIRFRSAATEKELKPGQQAVTKDGKTVIRPADADAVTAWKNNYFYFDGDNLGSIMRKVSRWYDVEVVYEYPEARNKEFGGTVSRFKNVSSVLDKLELTGGVHFRIENNKIIVTK